MVLGEITDVARVVDVPLSGLHILVVDDNRDARVIFTSVLVQCGARVTVRNSAGAALAALRHLTPDLVLTDLAMPSHDGLWLVKQIRARPKNRGGSVPVIAISARDDLYENAAVLSAGFDAFLVKPVSHRDLVTALRRLAPATSASKSA